MVVRAKSGSNKAFSAHSALTVSLNGNHYLNLKNLCFSVKYNINARTNSVAIEMHNIVSCKITNGLRLRGHATDLTCLQGFSTSTSKTIFIPLLATRGTSFHWKSLPCLPGLMNGWTQIYLRVFLINKIAGCYDIRIQMWLTENGYFMLSLTFSIFCENLCSKIKNCQSLSTAGRQSMY